MMIVSVTAFVLWRPQQQWTEEEAAAVHGLWIGNLPTPPAEASNRYAADEGAAEFGHRLFFDTRFSANGEISCASCHLPELSFQDGLALAEGVGINNRRTMTIIGAAYSPWLFWDGRKDSLWAQALGPLESPVEHGSNRTFYAHLLAEHYRAEYEAIFGPLPDISALPRHPGAVDDPAVVAIWEALTTAEQQTVNRIFANMGKAIAAYERLIVPGPSRFDVYAQALIEGDSATMQAALNEDEIAGLRLFIGKAQCIQCHNGPLFTNNDFHNTGVPDVAGLPTERGRALGAQEVLADEFNCLGAYSDAAESDCAELRFMIAEGHELERQFRPTSLRNVVDRAPFMHAGQFATLAEVLSHYNTAPEAPAGHSELEPLDLSEVETEQIIAFLNSLNGPVNAEQRWLAAPAR
ncbi:cytochrome-c peroxidase [bacterium]|nr:cytochrome-c peroxidase [bacterium]